MARTRNKIAKEEVELIRKLVIQKANIEVINPVDCKHLANQIYTSTGQYISESTLKRFLGFHFYEFAPSYDTIKILKGFIDSNVMFQSDEQVAAELIVDFFKPIHFTAIDISDKSFQAACRRIAISLKKNKLLFESVMEILAKNEMSRRFYYDLFPDYEVLSSFQYKGYEKYLEYEKSYQGQMFGNCILFLKYFFDNDFVAMKKKYREISKIYNPKNNLHSFVLGRYYQTCIMSSFYFDNNETASVIREAFKIEKKVKNDPNVLFSDFPGFHYFVCDGLYNVGAYNELMLMINIALDKYEKSSEFEWKGYYDQLYLYNALALVNLGKIKEATKQLKLIKPERFYFISNVYFKKLYDELIHQLNLQK